LEDFFQNFGPEPLDETFTFRIFFSRLQAKKTRIKPLLLDQSFLAGLGNIYANEALFLARIHPAKSASKVTEKEAGRLFGSIRKVLQDGIENGGTSLGRNALNFFDSGHHFGSNQNFLLVHEKAGQLCPQCRKKIIQKVRLGQRSAYFCPGCQKSC
jgi:formamidopyrimidine-DNA glycosylase